MGEWLKPAALKAVEVARPPRVRIPPSPPFLTLHKVSVTNKLLLFWYNIFMDKNILGLDSFKYNVTRISLFLAIIITFVFFVLRLLDIIPRPSLATLNTTSLLFFLIAMYVCLLKCKNKLYTIQLVTYFVIITFITLQTVIAKYNVFLPVWVDFTILTAYITTNKKIAIIISVYSLFALFFTGASFLWLCRRALMICSYAVIR